MATIFFFYLFFFSFAFVRAADKSPVPPGVLPRSTTVSLASLKGPFQSKTPESWTRAVILTLSNDEARLSYLSSLAVARGPKVPVPIAYNKSLSQTPMYVVQIKIGKPAQKLLMAIDTSQDVALVPCSGRTDGASYAYDTSKSTTFQTVMCSGAQCGEVPRTCGPTSKGPCVFNSTYRESSFWANLVRDNIILGLRDYIPKYTFGCISNDTGTSIPTQGMLGLGRQSLSLLSQTPKLYKSTFSYCLPNPNSHKSFSGSLTLGTRNQPKNIKTTPLIGSNKLYVVNLTGIMVGKRVLNIGGGSGIGIGKGTIIDSGTVYSVLVGPAYIAVKKEIQRRMTTKTRTVFRRGGFDTCYNASKVRGIGSITLMFPGMNFTLRQDNFLLRSSDNLSYCLAMSTHPSIGFNVIGSFQQQNHRVLFDIRNSRLGVVQDSCS